MSKQRLTVRRLNVPLNPTAADLQPIITAGKMAQQEKDYAAFLARMAKDGRKLQRKIWVQILVSLAITLVATVLSVLLAPKPKKQKPTELDEFEGPTSEAGRPIPVVFGLIRIESPNTLWWGHKRIHSYHV